MLVPGNSCHVAAVRPNADATMSDRDVPQVRRQTNESELARQVTPRTYNTELLIGWRRTGPANPPGVS